MDENKSPFMDRRDSADRSLSGSWAERNGGKVLIALLIGATVVSCSLNGSNNIDQPGNHTSIYSEYTNH